jgi:AraC-like DNA-binding protein
MRPAPLKSTLERISPDDRSSFRLLVTPRLSGVFMWHYHPEYELVYIDGASGTRHVGEHISRYVDSDLVFIGPNIPHLNFDYGVRTDYRKIVVQLDRDFLGEQLWLAPEMTSVAALFTRARSGLVFHGATKAAVGEELTQLASLPPLDRLLSLLRIFQQLSESREVAALNTSPISSVYDLDAQQRLKRITHFVAEHYERHIELHEVADLVHLTDAAFCRYFKRMTQLTFTQFVNRYRVQEAQRLLLMNHSVTESAMACGFESLSYFNRVFRNLTGENPLTFRRRHQRAAWARPEPSTTGAA